LHQSGSRLENMAVNIGLPEVLLILLLILLLFGAKKLPELARGMGEALKEFRRAQKDERGDDQDEGLKHGEGREKKE